MHLIISIREIRLKKCGSLMFLFKKMIAINSHLHITQIQSGQPAPPQRGKYKAISERLVTVVGDYVNRPILDFLRGIAHNIQMWTVIITLYCYCFMLIHIV